MPVEISAILSRLNPGSTDYKLVGGSDVAIRNAYDLTGVTLVDSDTLLLDDTSVADTGTDTTDGTKTSTGKIELSQMATYITGATNFSIDNAKLLAALSSLESASGTGDENIVIGTDSGDTIVITGNLQVNGTTTTVSSTTITVDDKNIELGSVDSPTDVTADGGGITLKGTTDKTFNWVDTSDAWTSSEHIELATGKKLLINGTNGDVSIEYTDGSIANAEGFTFTVPDAGGAAYLELAQDGGLVNSDFWAIHNDGNLKLQSKISGTYQSFFTITPHATPADSQITIPGKIISNDGSTGSFILSGPNTDNHVTLEMYGDANIEKWKMLDTHTSGVFAFQNYANAAWQTMMSITPHATPSDSVVSIAGDIECRDTTTSMINLSPSTPAADAKIIFNDTQMVSSAIRWTMSFDQTDVNHFFTFDYGTKVQGAATKLSLSKDGLLAVTTINATDTVLTGDITAHSLYLKDIGNDHTMRIRLYEDSASDVELRFKLNDATRTINIGGDMTTEGDFTIIGDFTVAQTTAIDQDISVGASPSYNMTNMVGLPTSALSDGMVTYAKMQDISTDNRVLGRANAVTGTVQEVQIQTAMIADDAVSLAKMQNIDSMRVLGRASVGSGIIEELDAPSLKLMLSGTSDNDFVTVDTPSVSISSGHYARWASDGLEGRTVAQVRGDLGIADNEIIDWTVDQGSTNIHEDNIDVDLSSVVDWTADQGLTNIHVNNLAGSPYFDQLFLTDEIDMTFTGSSGQLKDVLSIHDDASSTVVKWLHTIGHSKGLYFTEGIISSHVDFADNATIGNVLSCYDLTGNTGQPTTVNILDASYPADSSIYEDLIVEHVHVSRFEGIIANKEEYTPTISSGTASIRFAMGSTGNCVKLTLTENLTSGLFFVSNPPGPCTVTIRVIQDGTGGRTITAWPAACKWPGGSEPLLSTGANDVDIVTFYFDGTNYYGTIVRDFS